jgi:hypothetical protein
MLSAAQVTGLEDTERRILLRFVRYGFSAQPASSVRGSSRRILTMRFRPADIRVINRRKLPLVLSPARARKDQPNPRKETPTVKTTLDKVAPY